MQYYVTYMKSDLLTNYKRQVMREVTTSDTHYWQLSRHQSEGSTLESSYRSELNSRVIIELMLQYTCTLLSGVARNYVYGGRPKGRVGWGVERDVPFPAY